MLLSPADLVCRFRGLGAMIAEGFAKEGCNVAVNYQSSEDKAHEVAKAVEACGQRAVVVQGVSSIPFMQLERLREERGRRH